MKTTRGRLGRLISAECWCGGRTLAQIGAYALLPRRHRPKAGTRERAVPQRRKCRPPRYGRKESRGGLVQLGVDPGLADDFSCELVPSAMARIGHVKDSAGAAFNNAPNAIGDVTSI